MFSGMFPTPYSVQYPKTPKVYDPANLDDYYCRHQIIPSLTELQIHGKFQGARHLKRASEPTTRQIAGYSKLVVEIFASQKEPCVTRPRLVKDECIYVHGPRSLGQIMGDRVHR